MGLQKAYNAKKLKIDSGAKNRYSLTNLQRTFYVLLHFSEISRDSYLFPVATRSSKERTQWYTLK